MAWMKSSRSGWWYLTGEFTQTRFKELADAREISDILGFNSAEASSEAIRSELDRVALNRAGLVKDIADAVLAGVASGASVAAPVDVAAIAAAVEAQLADEFAAVPDAEQIAAEVIRQQKLPGN